MDPDLICGNAQVLTAQREHLLGLPLPDYCFPVAHITPVMLVSFLLLQPAFIIWLQGLYVGSLSPTCLLYNTLSSFRSLLRT